MTGVLPEMAKLAQIALAHLVIVSDTPQFDPVLGSRDDDLRVAVEPVHDPGPCWKEWQDVPFSGLKAAPKLQIVARATCLAGHLAGRCSWLCRHGIGTRPIG
jgi:hypothetical protein